jgi:probable HAF family extracellular repeat protein
VGRHLDGVGNYHGFLLSNDNFSTIEPTGANQSEARGINSRGDIIGTFRGADFVTHAYVLSKGTFTPFDIPGAAAGSTRPRGINASGDISGNYFDGSGLSHGFLSTK